MEEYREQINTIDGQLITLLEERVDKEDSWELGDHFRLRLVREKDTYILM